MANNFLNLGTVSLATALLASGFAPSTYGADSDPSVTSTPSGRAPVPLVRKVPVTPRSVSSASGPISGSQPAEPTARDTFDSKAAKAAVEADGYQRVTVLGKAANGAWRAKGFRGATEVLVTVDSAGRVSTQ